VSFLSKITEMPWTTPGIDDDLHSHVFSAKPAKRVALVVFLAVVSTMFLLFMVAYYERMELPDWSPVVEPGILWFNSALLVLASLFMQRARTAADRDASPRGAMLLGGLLALGFLGGQLVAWNILAAQGYYTMANPAYAFFLLLTALHGLHLLGGLYVLARAVQRSLRGALPADLKPTIELCAIYWHYLLLLWVVLFVLMMTT